MPNADEIIRTTEERENRRQNEQNATARQTAQEAIVALLARLHELAHRIIGNREQQNLADAKQGDWVSQHLEFQQARQSPANLMTTALALSAVYPAVYLLDLFLLSGNARHLAKDFAHQNQILIFLTIALLPLAVLFFETGFQTQWAVAQTTGQRWLWGIASVVMCLVVPAVIVGFSMATTVNTGGARSAQVQYWQQLGKAALAFFAHFIILLGGRRAHEAKSYLVFKLKNRKFERQINRLRDRINTDSTTLTNTFTDYFQQLNAFNTTYSQNRLEPGPFDALTRNEINRVFGYEVIAAPPAQLNPPTDNSGNNNQSNANGNDGIDDLPPLAQNQNNQPNGNASPFDMDGEDEVRP